MIDPDRDPSNPLEIQQHKLQIYIPRSLFMELGEIFPHGMKRPVFQTLAEEVLELMKKTGNPDAVCAAIINREIRLEYRE